MGYPEPKPWEGCPDGKPFQSDLEIEDIYQLGWADFHSGYPPTWTPHLGSLAQDEAAWGIWRRGWEDAQAAKEDHQLSLLKAKHLARKHANGG